MNKQQILVRIAAFSAGATLTGLAAKQLIRRIEKQEEERNFYIKKVSEFSNVLVEVVDERNPELLADERVKNFFDKYKFDEIVQLGLGDLKQQS